VTSRALNRGHKMGLVFTVLAAAHQEFQVFQVSLDQREYQVFRDHPAIMDLKDPWAHEETRVTKALVEGKVPQASKVLQDP